MSKHAAKSAVKTGNLRSGDVCPKSGLWNRSCGCREISVKKDERFPPCEQCGRSIEFSATRSGK